MLNNKGITTVEVLICFILVTIIASSLYSTVAMFNEKRIEESNKSKILLYNNMLTHKIQSDFIKYGLNHAEIKEEVSGGRKIYTVLLILGNEEKRLLIITQQFTKSNIHLDGKSNLDDYFMIEYGPENELVKYPIPELGETKGAYDDEFNGVGTGTKTFIPCEKAVGIVKNINTSSDCKILKDLEINNVIINISNEQSMDETGSHVLNIYIGFYHPELGNRYAINILSPINFPLVNSNKSIKFGYDIIKKPA